jgi:adenylate cyclase
MIKEKFAKKVSPQVVEELLKHPDRDTFEIKEKEASIFFSDIRSFTSISEALGDPKRLIALLNRYMTPMVDIIIEERGTIDKFIGDAIMAYWNAPQDLPNHADHAVTAALRQIERLAPLNETFRAEGFPTIDIGIGIHSGIATVGEMGSTGRSDYTIIGDNVNLASRMEGLNKFYGTHIILSEHTKELLQNEYTLRILDTVRVKGKEKPVTIYEAIALGSPDDAMKKRLQRYHEGVALYQKGRFGEALTIFEALHEEKEEKVVSLYLQRCRHYLEHPDPAFDGVHTFTTK